MNTFIYILSGIYLVYLIGFPIYIYKNKKLYLDNLTGLFFLFYLLLSLLLGFSYLKGWDHGRDKAYKDILRGEENRFKMEILYKESEGNMVPVDTLFIEK